MPCYICPRCLYETNNITNIKRHCNSSKCKKDKNGKDIDPKLYLKCIKPDPNKYFELMTKSLDVELYKNMEHKLKLENEELILKNHELTLKLSKYEKGGYIYVLHNPIFESYGDSVYKVGCSRNPQLRLKDFSTSYATESIIVYQSEFFNNKLLAEKELFNKLSKYRYNKSREFFDIPLDKIIEYISNITM